MSNTANNLNLELFRNYQSTILDELGNEFKKSADKLKSESSTEAISRVLSVLKCHEDNLATINPIIYKVLAENLFHIDIADWDILSLKELESSISSASHTENDILFSFMKDIIRFHDSVNPVNPVCWFNIPEVYRNAEAKAQFLLGNARINCDSAFESYAVCKEASISNAYEKLRQKVVDGLEDDIKEAYLAYINSGKVRTFGDVYKDASKMGYMSDALFREAHFIMFNTTYSTIINSKNAMADLSTNVPALVTKFYGNFELIICMFNKINLACSLHDNNSASLGSITLEPSDSALLRNPNLDSTYVISPASKVSSRNNLYDVKFEFEDIGNCSVAVIVSKNFYKEWKSEKILANGAIQTMAELLGNEKFPSPDMNWMIDNKGLFVQDGNQPIANDWVNRAQEYKGYRLFDENSWYERSTWLKWGQLKETVLKSGNVALVFCCRDSISKNKYYRDWMARLNKIY